MDKELLRDLRALLKYLADDDGWPILCVYNSDGQHYGITDEHLAQIIMRIQEHVYKAEGKEVGAGDGSEV